MTPVWADWAFADRFGDARIQTCLIRITVLPKRTVAKTAAGTRRMSDTCVSEPKPGTPSCNLDSS